MRILADLRSHLSDPPAPEVIQVQRVPADGVTEAINGKYAIPSPLALDFPIDSDSYILNLLGEIDSGSLVTESYAHLLALYPAYANVYFNPLLTSDHVDELVLDQTFWFTDNDLIPPGVFYPRFQTGREGAINNGQMPTSTAMLASNNSVPLHRPGMILTDEIDIGPYTLNEFGVPVGTDAFMVYWKVYAFTESHDVAADAGLLAGTNTPAYRYLAETDQEFNGLTVYITGNDGISWHEVERLTPFAFSLATTTIRLAFRNDTSSKVFLASYALMF